MKRLFCLVALIGLAGLLSCSSGSKSFTSASPVAKIDDLSVGGQADYAGLGVAIADIDGDGFLEIIVSSPTGIKIYKNPVRKK